MSELQRTTNEGIAALVRGVDPLEGGIARTSDNTERVGDRMVELRELIPAMLDELKSLRSTLEPVGDTSGSSGSVSGCPAVSDGPGLWFPAVELALDGGENSLPSLVHPLVPAHRSHRQLVLTP